MYIHIEIYECIFTCETYAPDEVQIRKEGQLGGCRGRAFDGEPTLVRVCPICFDTSERRMLSTGMKQVTETIPRHRILLGTLALNLRTYLLVAQLSKFQYVVWSLGNTWPCSIIL